MLGRLRWAWALAAVLCACAQPAPRPAPVAAPAAAPAALSSSRSRLVGTGEYSLQLGQSELRVKLDTEAFDLEARVLLDWILRCARAVEAYYGMFPVPEAELWVHATPGRGVNGGHTESGSPPRIDIEVGVHASARELDLNWSLTHELVHLAFPNLARPHLWLEEGLASYVEPLARARVRWLNEADVWHEWLDNLQRGNPEAGDRGLDHTPTWGRTYWGGALFCFLADLELRQRTGGRYELRDALRGILTAGGNINEQWSIERALSAGDAATQTDTLTRLYRKMKDAPVNVDLEGIWLDLGVRRQGAEIRYNDAARLAEVRKTFVLGLGAAPVSVPLR